MAKIVITIARQYGSGGREIGEKVSQILNIKQYDSELITLSSQKSNISEEILKTADEKATNSLLYTLAMGSNMYGSSHHFGYNMPINDRLFATQSGLIREIADRESCIIIGRCGDYILRNYENVIRIFIYAPIEDRKKRVAKRHPELKPSDVISLINKTDKRRSSYYNFYTGNRWGKYDNYDYAINSSCLGIDGTAEMIADIARMKNKNK